MCMYVDIVVTGQQLIHQSVQVFFIKSINLAIFKRDCHKDYNVTYRFRVNKLK